MNGNKVCDYCGKSAIKQLRNGIELCNNNECILDEINEQTKYTYDD